MAPKGGGGHSGGGHSSGFSSSSSSSSHSGSSSSSSSSSYSSSNHHSSSSSSSRSHGAPATHLFLSGSNWSAPAIALLTVYLVCAVVAFGIWLFSFSVGETTSSSLKSGSLGRRFIRSVRLGILPLTAILFMIYLSMDAASIAQQELNHTVLKSWLYMPVFSSLFWRLAELAMCGYTTDSFLLQLRRQNAFASGTHNTHRGIVWTLVALLCVVSLGSWATLTDYYIGIMDRVTQDTNYSDAIALGDAMLIADASYVDFGYQVLYLVWALILGTLARRFVCRTSDRSVKKIYIYAIILIATTNMRGLLQVASTAQSSFSSSAGPKSAAGFSSAYAVITTTSLFATLMLRKVQNRHVREEANRGEEVAYSQYAKGYSVSTTEK